MTLLYIINTPTVYQRLREEIEGVVKSEEFSDTARLQKYATIQRLPYLQAVIREGMRIFPGATPLIFKTVPPTGDSISGKHLPGGTQVGANVYGILRSEKYWGKDADLFRPERWLGLSDERREEMNGIFEVMFGFGKYKCLGRPLVFMEMSKLLFEVS